MTLGYAILQSLIQSTFYQKNRDAVKKNIIASMAVLLLLSASIIAGTLSNAAQKEFEQLVKRLDYNPDDLLAGDRLRSVCREYRVNNQCIDALNNLSKNHPRNKSLKYQAALAYIDEVPGHTLFRQGWLSSRSMDHMSDIIKADPNDWTAHYVRGLNALYWPVSFRKLRKSINDLQRCITLSEQLPKGLIKPYHGFAYIALGDAYVKAGETEEGRKIYTRGKALFQSDEIEKRLKMADEELESYIRMFRNADHQVDTEISFLVNGGAEKL